MPDQPIEPRATQSIDLGKVVGTDGAPGQAATITVAGTNTTAPGTSASVTQGGTAQARTLTFNIPRGDPGVPGTTGDALQYPPVYNLGWNNTEGSNTLTIPGWTMADRSLILAAGSFNMRVYDYYYYLNINSLGRRMVYFASRSPVFGFPGDWPLDGRKPLRDANDTGLERRWPEYLPRLYMLRYNGLQFEEVRREDISRNLQFAYWGQETEMSHQKNLSAGMTIEHSMPLNRVTDLLAAPTAGISSVIFQSRRIINPGWNIFSSVVVNHRRKIIVRSWSTAPAGTIRFPNHTNALSIYSESEAYVRTVNLSYVVRVAKHLVDAGTCSKGVNYVDFAFPGGAVEVEISYVFSGDRTGLRPTRPTAGWTYSKWYKPQLRLNILDIIIMQ